MEVVVNQGPLIGTRGVVVDPTVLPDDHPDRRKMLVDLEGIGETLIIPKQLDLVDYVAPPVAHSVVVRETVPTANVVVSSTPIESLDDPSLDRFRPSRKDVVKQYVSRTLPGNVKDTDALMAYWRDRPNGYATSVGLVGDTESGKTMLVEVMANIVAKEMGLKKPLPIFTLSGNSSITDHDMFGQYRPDDSGNLVWMEGIVALSARLGGILYLDEVNAMPGNVTAGLHPLLDDRRQVVNVRKPIDDGHGGKMPEVIYANPDLWVISTYNPGYAGMSKANEALLARFVWLQWDYDEDVEKKLIKSAAIRLLGQTLRNARDSRTITTPIGTRALQRLERDVSLLGVDFAVWAFCGKFTSRNERMIVNTLIEDRSIKIMLHTEQAGVVAEPADAPTTEVTDVP
jgi:hypothetical protein